MTIKIHIARRMILMAMAVSTWSKCPLGRRHGCILALDGKYIISTGYNGLAKNENVNTPECQRDKDKSCRIDYMGNCPAIHAEQNAIINANLAKVNMSECVAYVTKQPCQMCMRFLQNSGIPVAIFPQFYPDPYPLNMGNTWELDHDIPINFVQVKTWPKPEIREWHGEQILI